MKLETRFDLGDRVVEPSMPKDVLTVLSVNALVNSVGQTNTYRLEGESGAQYTYLEGKLELVESFADRAQHGADQGGY